MPVCLIDQTMLFFLLHIGHDTPDNKREINLKRLRWRVHSKSATGLHISHYYRDAWWIVIGLSVLNDRQALPG